MNSVRVAGDNLEGIRRGRPLAVPTYQERLFLKYMTAFSIS